VLAAGRAPAVLMEVHPDVEKVLAGYGDGWIRALEQRFGRRIRVAGRPGMHVERVRVLEGASLEELERRAREDRREAAAWLDFGPGEVVTVGEADEEQELALAAAPPPRETLLTRLRRMLAR
jgi:hypothetical protein